METRTPRIEVPTWLTGGLIVFVIASIGYVYVYGGNPSTLASLFLGGIGVGITLFMVYLLYRFVVAFEKIADKY